MPTTSPLQGFPVMTNDDDPNIPEDILNLTKAIEKRVMGIYLSVADRDARITAPEKGQVAFLSSTNRFYFYNGSAWTDMFPVQPAITSGTTVPANTSGSNGDVFFKV